MVTRHVAKQLPRRFEIPRSERRANGDASVSGFGVNDWQTLKNIMDKTGCQIEVLATQDQTLAFLITGSDESFGHAKDELTAQFRTRTQDVSIPSVVPTPTTVQDAVCYYYHIKYSSSCRTPLDSLACPCPQLLCKYLFIGSVFPANSVKWIISKLKSGFDKPTLLSFGDAWVTSTWLEGC